MANRRFIFPHFSRRFPARFLTFGLKLGVLFLLAAFLFLTIHSLIFPEDEIINLAASNLLKNPNNPLLHLRLGEIFWQRNNFKEAREEFQLAAFFSQKEENVLGAATQAFEKAKEAPEKLSGEISFWEEVVKEKPDYRDAYLRLAVLNYQLKKKEAAREYLRKVKEEDPNFPAIRELERMLGE